MGSSIKADKELYLSSPTNHIAFEPLYNSDEELGPSTILNFSLLTESEYSGASRVGNTGWQVDIYYMLKCK